MKDLYDFFGLSKSATIQEIKTSYKKLALLNHPDKHQSLPANELQEKTKLFQDASKFYAILSDPEKRSKYDKTGSIDDVFIDKEGTWDDYFNDLFQRVTSDRIQEYEKAYRYSEDERKDVLSSYVTVKGDLLDLIDHVPLSNLDDIERFKDLITKAIDSGEVPKLRAFPKINKSRLKKKQKELESEAKEASDMGIADKEASLKLAIAKNQKGRVDNLMANLEEKYGKKNKKEKMPTDEEFDAFQKKLLDSKNKNQSTKEKGQSKQGRNVGPPEVKSSSKRKASVTETKGKKSKIQDEVQDSTETETENGGNRTDETIEEKHEKENALVAGNKKR